MDKMNRVVHFEIQADDMVRAQKFYEKTFGWKIAKWEPDEEAAKAGAMDYWLIRTGEDKEPGINGGLYERPKEGDKHYLYDCTISVPDIGKAIAAVKANGGTIIRDQMEMPGLGWFATAKDTEGNKFGMMQASPDMKMQNM